MRQSDELLKENNGVEIQLLLDEARFIKNNLGQSKKAIKLCDKILKTAPNNRDAMLIKAGALGEIFDLGKAEQLIKTIITKWPNNWEAYYLYALNYAARNEDEKALAMIDKSIELTENFDNIITKAQLLYFVGKDSYMEYVDKATKIDKIRAENFMKNHFVFDLNSVKPTPSELFNAIKSLIKKK